MKRINKATVVITGCMMLTLGSAFAANGLQTGDDAKVAGRWNGSKFNTVNTLNYSVDATMRVPDAIAEELYLGPQATERVFYYAESAEPFVVSAPAIYPEERGEFHKTNVSKFNVVSKIRRPQAIALVMPTRTQVAFNFASGELNYAPAKSGVFKYGSAVIIERNHMLVLKEKLKVARMAKNKEDVKAIRKRIAEVKFDLFIDEMHLVLAKEALRHDHLLDIRAKRTELANDRCDLIKAKSRLKKEVKAKNEAGIKSALLEIGKKEREVEQDKVAIQAGKARLKEDMQFADNLLK